MKTQPRVSAAAGVALEGIRLEGDLSPTQARALLKLHFSEPDLARMRELSAKARAGTLSAEEESRIDAYERLGCVLDMLHSKARRVLRQRKSVS